MGGVATVADGLLITEDEAGNAANPLETGQGHPVLASCCLDHASQTGRRDHRIGVDPVQTTTQGVVTQQGSEFVTGEHPPVTVDDGGNGTTVGVRVRGDDDVSVMPASLGDGQVDGARLLGVREGHGGEVRVRVELLSDTDELRQTGRLDEVTHDAGSDTVHGGVDPGDVRIGRGQFGSTGDVGVDEFVADELDVVTTRDRPDRIGRHDLDLVGDFGVGGRHDLGAVAQVHLVAVVGWRVVGGGHHDAGNCAVMLDGESGHRGRDGGVGQQGVEPGPRHDLGGVPGEDVRVVPGIETDDHRPLLLAVGTQPGRESGSRTLDDDSVHPGRSGSESGTQASGTEGQRAGEGRLNGRDGLGVTVLGTGEQVGQFGAGGLIRVLVEPGLNLGDEFGGQPLGLCGGHGSSMGVGVDQMAAVMSASRPASRGAASLPAAMTSAWSSGASVTPAA